MAREAFKEKIFNAEHEQIIERANLILAEYRAEDLTVTLRQLYYQFVARNWIKNKFTEYKRMGDIISEARMCGRIDWEAIEDRMRSLDTIPTWNRPADILVGAARQYREDFWDSQDSYIEVWVEKDALTGVVEKACRGLRVSSLACRGYNSQSELYRAGKRFAEAEERGRTPIIIHLGDHDPSGIDMTRDNRERVITFAGIEVEVRRIALNYDQVEGFRLPPNPAKETDSRSPAYIAQYGESSWELDAIDPRRLREMIQDEIRLFIDQDRWNECEEKENSNRKRLNILARQWTNDADQAGE